MKIFTILYFLLHVFTCLADTPPPGTVKANIYDSTGVGIHSTSNSLNVNITGGAGLTSTVNQGLSGAQSWLANITTSVLPTNACQETGGHLASIDTKLSSVPVTGTFWQATQPVSGTFWQATQPISASSLPLPTGAATNSALTTINTTLGSPFQVGGSIGNTTFGATQSTAANLNATVVGPSGVALAKDSSLSTINTTLGSPFQSGGSIGNISFIVTQPTGTNLHVVVDTAPTTPVTGTFWQATQPVSGPVTDTQLRATPVPVSGTIAGSGNFTVVQPTGTNLHVVVDTAPTTAVTGTFWQATQPVSGTFWQATQPISAASLPLPSGASTSAKQPALGTAGTASADVITIQGIASMTALKVDGSAVTQPVSGTFWQATQPVSGTFWQATQPISGTVTANIGTSGSLALDASVTGLQVAQNSTTSGQSGPLIQGSVTTAAPSYTTAKTSPLSLTTAGALRVDNSAVTQPVSGTFWQSTQPVSAASLPLPSGASTSAKQPALGTAGSASADVISVQGVASMTALKVDGSGVTQPVSGTFWQSTQPVSIATAPVLVAGSAIIGKVGIDQTTPGTTNLVALAANQSVNVAQINGVTPLMGNGGTGTGSQRVTIASDNTAFSVNAKPSTPAALTVTQAAVTIGTSAVRLTVNGSAAAATRVLLAFQLLSTSTANCYFGSSGVTTTSTTRGVQFFAGQVFTFNNDAGDYYGICDASSQTVLITEQE